MGFSRGGQATLYASLRRFQKMWDKSGIEFAAYIPFYPDCAFDNPLGPVQAAVVVNAQTVRHCMIVEKPAGVLISASTQQPFTYKDPCVELNPHVGYDAASTEAAKRSVKEFLKVVFKL